MKTHLTVGLAKLEEVLIAIRTGFWFLPMCIVVGCVAAGFAAVEAHLPGFDRWAQDRWLFRATREGGLAVLQVIASSMITVAGVVFSITMVVLSLTSNQYSSRILRTFIRDRANQTVLGIFLGIFSYSIVVMRGAGKDGEGAIPHLALLLAGVFAMMGVGFLIFFIHHIALSIQASGILKRVDQETLAALHEMFPTHLGSEGDRDAIAQARIAVQSMEWSPVPAREAGYIQTVAGETLLKLAIRHDLVFRMEYGIGDFVVKGTPLLCVAGGEVNEQLITHVNRVFVIDEFRTIEQDSAFGIQLIVDVALKALSPGINDTTTAVEAVDHLTEVLAQVADQPVTGAYRFEEGHLRIIARAPSFSDLVDIGMDPIRRASCSNVSVLLRLVRCVALLDSVIKKVDRRAVLLRQCGALSETARAGIQIECDRIALEREIELVRQKIDWKIEQSRREAADAEG